MESNHEEKNKQDFINETKEVNEAVKEFERELFQNESIKQFDNPEHDNTPEIKPIERVDIFKSIDFLPPDTINDIVSPSKFILKKKYLKQFDQDTREKVKIILKDDEPTLAIKKELINQIVHEYCESNDIRIEDFQLPAWVKLALMEVSSLIFVGAELRNLLKETEMLNKVKASK